MTIPRTYLRDLGGSGLAPSGLEAIPCAPWRLERRAAKNLSIRHLIDEGYIMIHTLRRWNPCRFAEVRVNVDVDILLTRHTPRWRGRLSPPAAWRPAASASGSSSHRQPSAGILSLMLLDGCLWSFDRRAVGGWGSGLGLFHDGEIRGCSAIPRIRCYEK